MATLQVRSIDDQLYKALGQRAAMDNRSISQEVITILKAYLSSPKLQHESATNAFLQLCGTWDDDRDAIEITDDIRKGRQSGRRFQETL